MRNEQEAFGDEWNGPLDEARGLRISLELEISRKTSFVQHIFNGEDAYFWFYGMAQKR